ACTVTSSNGELNLTLTPSSLSDDTDNERGNYSYKKVNSVEKINDGTEANLLIIRGLQIATGDVDHEDTVTVKVTDRAGNVSVNADGNDKAVIICDKSAPQYYKTVYKNESGQVNTVNGRPAFSYISKFFGNPTVISTHAGSGVEYKPGSPNISVAPGVPSTVFEPTTGWNAGAVYSDEIYTEAVLRFNKKGSGIRSIALPSAVEKRGLYFREIDADTHTEIWVQNDDDAEPVKYEYNKDYTLSGNESNKGYPTKLTFSSSDKCPRGENCAVIIRGINMDDNGRRAVTDGYYNLWCSNVTVTSFAGKSSTTEWGLCFALDVDTPEFIYEPVTFSDVTVGSKQYTDGTGITLKGKINAKSTDNIYGSGLWALKLDNAKFTASSKLTAKAYQLGTYKTETNPNNNLVDGTSYTYVYNGSADYSKRNVPSMNASDCELAPFVFDEPATNTKFSLSGDKKTMFLNIPLDFYYGSEFSISNLELDDAILGTDGEKTINVTLVKYSGL
ncbi:MAG: hypothetical protein HUK25_05795, partial [Treponema sp.]|nr:hypothetical protein [Treponema sp.]